MAMDSSMYSMVAKFDSRIGSRVLEIGVGD
jgi:hypothetical protein